VGRRPGRLSSGPLGRRAPLTMSFNGVRVLPWLVLVAQALPACVQPDWRVVESGDGRFSVEMPGAPTEEVRSASTASGDIEVHAFRSASHGVTYLLTFTDYPPDLVYENSTEAILRDFDPVHSSEFREPVILNDTQQLWQGFPARRVEILSHGGTLAVHMLVTFVGNRMYILMTTSEADDAALVQPDRFFDSFQAVGG